MISDQAPPLPSFIADQMPYRRYLYTLSSGQDAGRKLHFVDHGDTRDRPVVMLHGNPTWSFLWRKVIAELNGFRCVAPDLLGLGLSERLPHLEDHTIDRHVDAVSELLEALELQQCIFVCQDWGGPILTAVGARIPERVAGLVIANTAVVLPRRLRGSAFHRFARMPLISDVAFRLFGFPQNLLHRAQGDPRSIRGDVARAYKWPLRRVADRVAPLALARMVPDGPAHPSVPIMQRTAEWVVGFSGPLAMVWGVRDPILGRALSRHEKALPRATVYRTQSGHFLQEEVPDVISEAIRLVAA